MPSKRARPRKKGIQVRIDADMSERAERIFKAIGIDTPTAIRMFFAKVAVTGGIPFPVRDDASEAYSPNDLAEIDAAYVESFHKRNIHGPFATVEGMFCDIARRKR